MNRRAVHLAAALYAVVDLAVVAAPSLVLAVTAQKGGVSGLHGVDLVLASFAVGGVHAVVAFSRLVRESRLAARPLDVWLAAGNSLVVLALGATVLMIVVLGGFAGPHGVLVNQGWDVVWLWVGVLLVAVALSELTGRAVFRWLEGDCSARRAIRRRSPVRRLASQQPVAGDRRPGLSDVP